MSRFKLSPVPVIVVCGVIIAGYTGYNAYQAHLDSQHRKDVAAAALASSQADYDKAMSAAHDAELDLTKAQAGR